MPHATVNLKYLVATALWAVTLLPSAKASCHAGTLYLSLDTGNMEPANAILDILDHHRVKATFFVANEKTKSGGWTLDDSQKTFWQRVVNSGHAIGSHTWDHHYFRGNVGTDRVRYVPWGAPTNTGRTLDRDGICAELRKPETRFRELTGRGFDHIWRAPGGKTTPRLIAFATQCGFRHIGWSDAGFLGDELPSEQYSNAVLLQRAVNRLRNGDVLMMHLGIWSRQEAFWPTLDPLLTRLQTKGFCFATIPQQSTLSAPKHEHISP